ncbi:DUF86 domain-containing protein [Heliobacillus mobilis]|uniref:DUF86 domain-containing protein n=1 Tax=Heliobacterium mobile TaxID=28064 RepID=A0A6I3SR25_HELMO|nr:DUF86 domain-containing protein [Heliobacterium mobile]MTV50537.1 DUF86 domain-containing protein [Heliobacterium mobile]
MVDQRLMSQKISLLVEYLQDLKEVRDDEALSLPVFQADKKLKRYVERTLHLAIECCLDIGSHIIADERFREPMSNKDIFVVLAEEGVINRESLSSLQGMAKFRNILVHDYAKIDSEIIYGVLKKNLSDIENYVEQLVKKYL